MRYLVALLLFPCVALAAPLDVAPVKYITFKEDPTPILEPKTPPPAQGYSVLSARGIYGLQHIVSRDKTGGQKADLSSEPSFGAQLRWKMLWSETWSAGARITHQTVAFRKFGSGDLANKTIRLGDVEFFSEARLGAGLNLRIAGGQKTMPIVRAKTAGVATIDTPIASYAGAGIAASLLRNDKLSLAVQAGFNSIFGLAVGSYKLKTTPEYYAGPTFTQRLKDAFLDLTLIYIQQDSETSITKQRASSLAAIVGVSFEVGK